MSKYGMEGKIESLPAWAQRKIAHLEQAIVNLRGYYGSRLKQASGTDRETKTPVALDMAYEVIGYAPTETRVAFTLTDGSVIKVFFTKDRDGIEVYKESVPGKWGISVKPETTNVIEVS